MVLLESIKHRLDHCETRHENVVRAIFEIFHMLIDIPHHLDYVSAYSWAIELITLRGPAIYGLFRYVPL